jgi:sulfide:quinone oxidoreductase
MDCQTGTHCRTDGRNTAHNILSKEKGKTDFKGYQDELNILCVMDTGDGAAFVFRDDRKSFLIPMPLLATG